MTIAGLALTAGATIASLGGTRGAPPDLGLPTPNVPAEAAASPPRPAASPAPAATPRPVRRARPSAPARAAARHFQRLSRGDVAGAFALFTPAWRRRHSGWVASRAAAQPRIRIAKLGPTRIAGDRAAVRIRFYARDTVPVANSDTKCRRFSGTVHMRRVAGRWRYAPGNDLARQILPASLSACP